MRREQASNIWLLSALIAALLLFIVFIPSYGWMLRALFTPSNVIPGGDIGTGIGPDASGNAGAGMESLVAQNEQLKAQLAELQNIAAQVPTSSAQYVRAVVYSRYPFNFKNEILVNAGSDQGIVPGAAVTFNGLFVGRVSSTWPDYSEVITVFDNNFRMPVRVGSGGYDGLLTGGSYPYIASMAKNARVNINDIVYTAAAGMPYALPVGEVQATGTSPDNLFGQVSLMFPYDVNSVDTVLIVK